MNVWIAVNSYATGNQIPAPPDTRHNWLSLWRLGGQLAGRLDPEPAVLSGDGRARSTLRKVNELPPWCRWIASGFSRPASRSCPATTVSFEPQAPTTPRVARPFESRNESSCPLAVNAPNSQPPIGCAWVSCATCPVRERRSAQGLITTRRIIWKRRLSSHYLRRSSGPRDESGRALVTGHASSGNG